jgi:hypothetical protein
MANLKRHTIQLVKEVKEGEIITETYITPVFLPFSTVYEATDLLDDVTHNKKKKTERKLIEELVDFVVNRLYKGQFTKEELNNGLHGPDAVETLYAQLTFIARGEQDEVSKKFLAKKNS